MRLKLIDNHSQGHGKKQALIALNINELALLQGMALEMSNTLPSTGPTKRLQMVSRQMSMEMQKAIKALEESGIDDRTTKLYPYDDRAVL